jgi:apolipoprotein N-acyltransferase
VSGVLLALSFPRYGHPAFAWVALVPLLIALTGWRGRADGFPDNRRCARFALGLTAGMVYFIGTVYWTSSLSRHLAGSSCRLPSFAMLLLALYLALFPAMTSLITSRLIARGGAAGLFFAPGAWVSTEFFRGYLLGGFPWVPLGNSQVTVLPVAQLASVFGVYGLSALVALVNAAIAFALLNTGRTRVKALAVPIVLVLAIGGVGSLANR